MFVVNIDKIVVMYYIKEKNILIQWRSMGFSRPGAYLHQICYPIINLGAKYNYNYTMIKFNTFSIPFLKITYFYGVQILYWITVQTCNMYVSF